MKGEVFPRHTYVVCRHRTCSQVRGRSLCFPTGVDSSTCRISVIVSRHGVFEVGSCTGSRANRTGRAHGPINMCSSDSSR